LEQQLFRFFCEQVPIRSRIDDDRFDLPAHHAACFIDFFDCHQHDITQRYFADGHRAAEGVQYADFNGRTACGVREGIVTKIA
jgi:hypothetical protein